jgi:hypothetical protein
MCFRPASGGHQFFVWRPWNLRPWNFHHVISTPQVTSGHMHSCMCGSWWCLAKCLASGILQWYRPGVCKDRVNKSQAGVCNLPRLIHLLIELAPGQRTTEHPKAPPAPHPYLLHQLLNHHQKNLWGWLAGSRTMQASTSHRSAVGHSRSSFSGQTLVSQRSFIGSAGSRGQRSPLVVQAVSYREPFCYLSG